jgi:hypothetical protein
MIPEANDFKSWLECIVISQDPCNVSVQELSVVTLAFLASRFESSQLGWFARELTF